MKRSEIYRRAAKLLASGRAHYEWSCYAIGQAAGDPLNESMPAVTQYNKLFSPFSRKPASQSEHYRQHVWGREWSEEERRDCRILALCFMAAIADEEERDAHEEAA